MSLSSCPVCGGRRFTAAVPAAALRAEIRERNEFVFSRLRRRAHVSELKDLTDFMHQGEADVLSCGRCGLLLRDEQQVRAADSYEEDQNDPDLMQHVYPRYLEAFRKKAPAYLSQLRPHAGVIEIGSHLGGFLQAAEEWNWRATGLDIGWDTSEFARRQGVKVVRETLDGTRIKAGSADAVFIWNCFEQLTEPERTLLSARELLNRHGLLILRVPNARAWMDLRSDAGEFARSTLAWNNLLGFPYLYGYTAHSLNALVRRFGFEPVRGYNSELLTMPFPDPSAAVTEEQRMSSAAAAAYSTQTTRAQNLLTGPWIEIVYRKQEEVSRRAPQLDLQFLNRAA